MKRSGTVRIELDSVSTGDIVSIAGMAAAGIADTVATYTAETGLDPGNIEPPTMRCEEVDLGFSACAVGFRIRVWGRGWTPGISSSPP